MNEKTDFRAGYVCVAGRPNVGKSTLTNRLVGTKISIVTPKPQTTRRVIRGILTRNNAQVIFFDTAGVHTPKDRLGTVMVESAVRSMSNADIVYYMIESTCVEVDETFIKILREAAKPTFLVINKIDLVKKQLLLGLIDRHRNAMHFDEIIPVSARDGENTENLLGLTINRLPCSPPYYPQDIVSDQIERDFIAEFIRERIFKNMRDEIPYSTEVLIDDMKERSGGGAYISATVYLEKESQKAIVIGKSGSMIKKIGKEARYAIESLLGYKVFLDLRVKTEKKWRGSPKSLKKFGYR